jgi:hypothetical protein
LEGVPVQADCRGEPVVGVFVDDGDVAGSVVASTEPAAELGHGGVACVGRVGWLARGPQRTADGFTAGSWMEGEVDSEFGELAYLAGFCLPSGAEDLDSALVIWLFSGLSGRVDCR